MVRCEDIQLTFFDISDVESERRESGMTGPEQWKEWRCCLLTWKSLGESSFDGGKPRFCSPPRSLLHIHMVV